MRTALSHPPEASPGIKAAGKLRAASWSRRRRRRSRNLPGTGPGSARVPGSPGGGPPAGSAAGRGAGGRRAGGGCGARSRRRGRGAVGRVVVGGVVVGGDRTGPLRRSCARGSKVAEAAAGRGSERRSADTPWAGLGGVPRGGVTPRPADATALRSARRRERRPAQARGAGAETAGRKLWGGCVGAAAGRSRETRAPRAASPGISRAPWASSGEVLGQRHLPRG